MYCSVCIYLNIMFMYWSVCMHVLEGFWKMWKGLTSAILGHYGERVSTVGSVHCEECVSTKRGVYKAFSSIPSYMNL